MTIHLFEFMDHPRTPRVIRQTLLDVLEYCNRDFRPYYREVAAEICEVVQERGIQHIVEAGAGSAPLTRQLAANNVCAETTLTPCDLYPEPDLYRSLAEGWPDRVQPVFEPLDLTEARSWSPNTAIVLCATLHHIPAKERSELLKTMRASAACVMIFEPIRRTPLSMFLVLFAVIPALLAPLNGLLRAGSLRRVLFCWLLPIVPLMFVWDGLISCLRQWSDLEWRSFAESIPPDMPRPQIVSRPHSQVVIW